MYQRELWGGFPAEINGVTFEPWVWLPWLLQERKRRSPARRTICWETRFFWLAYE